MKPRSQPSLIIVDGSLPSLCAVWAAGVSGASPDAAAFALAPSLHGPGSTRRAALIRRWPAMCSLAELVELTDIVEPHVDTPAESPEEASSDAPVSRAGYEQSSLLLAACHLALSKNLTRVVWPIHLGDVGGLAGPDQAPPLDLIADACDRAMLAAQLASVDAGRASMGVTIELPFVDYSDKQMIEVALDLGAPLAACWWCRRDPTADPATPCGQCEPCARWQRALSAASPGANLGQIVTRTAASRGQRAGA